MTFKLPTSQEKADYVLRQFDRIADGYDLTNDAISFGMHRLWKARAVGALVQSKDGSYLDVCTGTGDLALAIAKRLNKNGQVVGLDFSSGMLDVACRRLSKQAGNLQAIVNFVQGDAEKLPFANHSFDGAIVSFGLRNLTHLSKGVSEMARVVKPGGKVIDLDLGHSTLPVFKQAFAFFFRHVVPVIGGILQQDRQAYTYLPESLNTYPEPDGITALFENASLINVRHISLAMGSVALHVGEVP